MQAPYLHYICTGDDGLHTKARLVRPDGTSATRYDVWVTKKGAKRQTKTFATKAAAEKWARNVESEIERGSWVDQSAAQAFLVAISRQTQTLTLFTDNTQQFKANAAKHLGVKSSAIESREEAARGDFLRGLMDRLDAAKRAEPARDRQRDERDLSR